MAEWKGKELALSDWGLEFHAVEITDDAMATTDDIKEEASFLSKADKAKTPSKKRRDEVEEIMESDFVILGGRSDDTYQKILPNEGSMELENQISVGFKKGVVTRVVAGVESRLESMSKGMVELSQLTHTRFRTVEESVRVFGGVLQTLRTKIGREVPVHERFEAPTLWGTTSFIADELTRVDKEVLHLFEEVEPVKTSIKVLENHVENLKDVKESSDKLVQIVTIMMKRIQMITPEISQMKSELNNIRLAGKTTRIENVDTTNRQGGVRSNYSAVDDLMSLVCDDSVDAGDDQSYLKSPGKDRTMVPVISTSGRLMNEDSGSKRSNDAEVSEHQDILIRQLIKDVQVLKSTSQDSSSIKFGNLGFRNIHQCSNWIEKHFSGLRYGLIMDPLLMLERIYGDDEVDSMSLMKTLESRLKLKIETGAEASALNALRHACPRIFHKGRPTILNSPNKSRLNQMSSHSEWKTGGEEIKSFIIQKMNILHASIASDIATEFGRDPNLAAAQMVASMSLTATVTFITQLLGMVDNMYERLFVCSKFTSDQAWSLTTQVLDRVLADLYAPKDGIGESLTTRSPLSICTHLMWSSFRTHDVMTQYVIHNFDDHPAISTEYVKFLATNSGSDKVSKLGDLVDALKVKVATATDESKKAVAKADTASSKNAELVREVAALTKRLKYLEDKMGK